MKKLIILLLMILSSITFSETTNDGNSSEDPIIPMIPILPAIPNTGENSRTPLEHKTVIMGMTTEVVIPLEIISDIEIQAMVIDNQEIEVPFEIEFNKTPDKNKSYSIIYSQTEIDIDDDGVNDTFIYSNRNIDSKILKDNKVVIKGANISKEGYHEKIIYLEVETHD